MVRFIKDIRGDAVVEATILFPVMVMVFAALVVLSVYLPTRAVLQRATQYAATAIAAEMSDTWLFHNDNDVDFYRAARKRDLRNVYVDLFSVADDVHARGDKIVRYLEGNSISSKAGEIKVECHVFNRFIYKEVIVTATREYKVPDGLRFILPANTVPITVTSVAVVVNGDEFIRNMDIAADFTEFIFEKYELDNVTDAISGFSGKLADILGR